MKPLRFPIVARTQDELDLAIKTATPLDGIIVASESWTININDCGEGKYIRIEKGRNINLYGNARAYLEPFQDLVSEINVTLHDSSILTCFAGAVNISAFDSSAVFSNEYPSNIHAYDKSIVYAERDAMIVAEGHSRIVAMNGTTVRASGNAKVWAFGEVTVHCSGHAKVLSVPPEMADNFR